MSAAPDPLAELIPIVQGIGSIVMNIDANLQTIVELLGGDDDEEMDA